MKIFSRIAPLLLFWPLLAAVPAWAEGEPEVLVELDRTRIFEGESVRYRVTINHVDAPEPPVLEGFEAFEVTPLGSRSLNARSITIINGQRSETIRYGEAFDFGLTPKKTGTLTVPAPRAVVDGKTLRGRALKLEVVPPRAQDVVRVELSTDRRAVYPLQPFTITVRVLVRGLPEPLADRSPLRVQQMPPMLTIPWVPDEQLPAGVNPEVDWQRWLGPLQDGGAGGFIVNELGTSSLMSLLGDRFATFTPAPKQVKLPNKPEKYWEYRFARTFTAERVGPVKLGPVSLKGRFATEVDERGRLTGEDFYVVAKAITVDVKDVPQAGRPAEYAGAIGKFTLRGELSPTTAKVGDPLTLSLKLAGQGTLDAVLPPDLKQLPNLAQHFKIYEPTTASDDEGRTFTYSLRPLDAQVAEFPGVPLAYFDVEQEKYVTLRTDPIALDIAPADQLTARPRDASDSADAPNTLKTQEKGLFANTADLSAVRDERVRPWRWAMGGAALAGTYLAALLAMRRRERESGAGDRRREARQLASERLTAARDALEHEDWRAAADHLRRAIGGLVASAADVPEEGLTTSDARRALESLAAPTELTNGVARLLAACDDARYGGSQTALQALASDADALVADLLHHFYTF